MRSCSCSIKNVPTHLENYHDLCELAITKSWRVLSRIPYQYQTAELCRIALQQDKHAIELVNHELPEYDAFCIEAIQTSWYNLPYIKYPTPDHCILAIEQDARAITYLPVNIRNSNRYHEICLVAVRKVGTMLEYVRNQTHEICLAAVQQNGHALYHVHDKTDDICIAAVQQNKYAKMYAPRDKDHLFT